MAKKDEPVEVRKGEELDLVKVGEFLRDSIPGLKGNLTVKQFPSGFSNLTYLIMAENREMILRRPPFGKKPKSGHDMSREYRILKALKPVFKYCPEPLVYTEDPAVMGCPFYVMERINGLIIRKNLPEGMVLDPASARILSENLIKVLCELHSVDYRKAGLSDFGKPDGYVRRQVEGWIGRYRDARTPDAPDYENIMKWLADTMPPDTDRPCLIHNDYKYDNVVLNPQNPLEIIGILDWEMATIGDPLMDLGNSVAYWIEKDDPPNVQIIRMMATNIEGMLSRRDQVALYGEIMGSPVKDFDFYYCFGLFRLAVIAQQIYFRFYHGQTRDERFKMLIGAVKILETAATQVVETSKW